jgi:hypothetical protein
MGCLFAYLLSYSLPVHAEKPSPVLNGTLGLTSNRLGFSLDTRYGLRFPMFEKEGSTLFNNTGLTAQGTSYLSPAYMRWGGRVTFSPLAIIDLTGYGAYSQYFGNFQTIVDYDAPNQDYGNNKEIAAYVTDTSRQYSGKGWNFGGALTLKAKVGPFIALANENYSYWSVKVPEGATGDYFFEREQEVMMAYSQSRLSNFNGLLMWESQNPRTLIRVGSITTHRYSFEAEDTLFRTGLIGIVGKKEKVYSHTFIVQGYLEDRAMTDFFPPYIAYAFRFTNG